MAKQVTLGPDTWVFDEDALSLNDAFAIKQASGLNLGPFLQGIYELDPLALQTLIWFLRRPTEPGLPLTAVTINRIGDLRMRPIAVKKVEDPLRPPAPAAPAARGRRAPRSSTTSKKS
jgi:hypothetical protein